MVINFKESFGEAKKVAAAVSGGSDSMALLCALLAAPEKNGAEVVAINVEHGIRGECSLYDSKFVKNFCKERGVRLAEYSVNAAEYAKQNGLSVEQAARKLRYDCFMNAIESGFCDVVATAHHALDNLETVLFNLFRGSGLKGVCGIAEKGYGGKIVRPLLRYEKSEINEYIKLNNVPFVTDETNFSDEYSRNFLRLNVIPKIKELFPEAEKSVSRFSALAVKENDYLDKLAENALKTDCGTRGKIARLSADLPEVVFNRATIKALNYIGVTKDWEKKHADAVFSLAHKETGKILNLVGGAVAEKRYGEVIFYLDKNNSSFIGSEPRGNSCNNTCGNSRDNTCGNFRSDACANTRNAKITEEFSLPFTEDLNTFSVNEKEYVIERIPAEGTDLKSGLYLAAEKVPRGAVIRFMKAGDTFTKFGGGTKKLCDLFTDDKIPKEERGYIPLLADGNKILAIFATRISEDAKACETTKTLIKISQR